MTYDTINHYFSNSKVTIASIIGQIKWDQKDKLFVENCFLFCFCKIKPNSCVANFVILFETVQKWFSQQSHSSLPCPSIKVIRDLLHEHNDKCLECCNTCTAADCSFYSLYRDNQCQACNDSGEGGCGG